MRFMLRPYYSMIGDIQALHLHHVDSIPANQEQIRVSPYIRFAMTF
tara:strand:- start:1405 stop:1542 length:138 start_codon:yes stop_codon:yes gene_type:complete